MTAAPEEGAPPLAQQQETEAAGDGSVPLEDTLSLGLQHVLQMLRRTWTDVGLSSVEQQEEWESFLRHSMEPMVKSWMQRQQMREVAMVDENDHLMRELVRLTHRLQVLPQSQQLAQLIDAIELTVEEQVPVGDASQLTEEDLLAEEPCAESKSFTFVGPQPPSRPPVGHTHKRGRSYWRRLRRWLPFWCQQAESTATTPATSHRPSRKRPRETSLSIEQTLEALTETTSHREVGRLLKAEVQRLSHLERCEDLVRQIIEDQLALRDAPALSTLEWTRGAITLKQAELLLDAAERRCEDFSLREVIAASSASAAVATDGSPMDEQPLAHGLDMELGLLMNGGPSAAANPYPSLEDGYKSLPLSSTLLSHLSVPFLRHSQSLSHDNLTQSVENLLAVIGSDFNTIRVDVQEANHPWVDALQDEWKHFTAIWTELHSGGVPAPEWAADGVTSAMRDVIGQLTQEQRQWALGDYSFLRSSSAFPGAWGTSHATQRHAMWQQCERHAATQQLSITVNTTEEGLAKLVQQLLHALVATLGFISPSRYFAREAVQLSIQTLVQHYEALTQDVAVQLTETSAAYAKATGDVRYAQPPELELSCIGAFTAQVSHEQVSDSLALFHNWVQEVVREVRHLHEEMAKLKDRLEMIETAGRLLQSRRNILEDHRLLSAASETNRGERLLNKRVNMASQLLREEQARKRAARELPSIMRTLSRILEKWVTSEPSAPFVVAGVLLADTIKGHCADLLKHGITPSDRARSRSRTPPSRSPPIVSPAATQEGRVGAAPSRSPPPTSLRAANVNSERRKPEVSPPPRGGVAQRPQRVEKK